jgi:sulfur relay (sulfurtransferase) DsrC/TusE family protein
MTKMIIAHKLSFSFVEYHWFNQLMKYNNSLYQKVSRTTIIRDCIKVIEVEREEMKKSSKILKLSHLQVIVGLQTKSLGTCV